MPNMEFWRRWTIFFFVTQIILIGNGSAIAQGREEIRVDEMPQLEISSIRHEPLRPSPGKVVRLFIEVANHGEVSANGVDLVLRANGIETEKTRLNLDPHSSRIVELRWQADREGQTELEAELDPDAHFVETNRGDNVSVQMLIVAAPASDETDFAVSDLQIEEHEGERLVRAVVENHGSTTTNAPFELSIGDRIIHTELLRAFNPGEIRTIEIPIPEGIAGQKFQAFVNPRNSVTELKVHDNVFVRDLRLDVDLAVEDLRILSNKSDQSPEVTVAFRIHNRGKADIALPFQTRLALAQSVQNSVPVPVIFNHSGLAVGDVLYVSHIFSGDSDLLDINVTVDSNGAIAEIDESNNTIRQQVHRRNPEIGRWVSIGPKRIDDIPNYGWSQASGRLSMIQVHPTNPSTLYVGAQNGGVWKSTNGGNSWFSVWQNLPTQQIAAIALDPSDPERVFAATHDEGIFHSPDGGNVWHRIIGPELKLGSYNRSLYYHPGRGSLLVNNGGKVYQAVRSGTFWQNWKPVLQKGNLVRTLVGDLSNVSHYLATVEDKTNPSQAGVYETFDGGDTWQRLRGCPGGRLPSEVSGRGITVAFSQGHPYVGYFWGTGLKDSIENPERWHVQVYRPSGIACSIGGVHEISWELGWDHTSSTGENHYTQLWAHPGNENLLFIRGVNLWGSSDGGRSFRPVGTYSDKGSPHADHHANGGHVSQPALVYALGDGGIYRSLKSGTKGTWHYLGEGLRNVEFYDHVVAPTNSAIVIGGTQDNGTILWDAGKGTWREIMDGDGASVAIDVTDDKVFYAMYQYADSIQRSTDGGEKFYPAAGSGSDRLPGFNDPPKGSKGSNMPFHVHHDPKQHQTLLAADIDGPLYRTTDRGKTWKKIFSPEGRKIVRSAIDGSVDLYYAGSKDGHLYAGSKGENFVLVSQHLSKDGVPIETSVRDIAVDIHQPSVVYVAYSGGGQGRVHRLQRQGVIPNPMLDMDITEDLPINLAVQTLAVDVLRENTIYVGTQRGVYRGQRMNNGAWSWDEYSQGMPRGSNVQDLEVHASTGILRAATYGRSAYEVMTDTPIGSLSVMEGRLTLLHVHDVGTGYGSPHDHLDTEVIVRLDSEPRKAFGFKLRTDHTEPAHKRMLDVLRDAFADDRRVQLTYMRQGLNMGILQRVSPLPQH